MIKKNKLLMLNPLTQELSRLDSSECAEVVQRLTGKKKAAEPMPGGHQVSFWRQAVSSLSNKGICLSNTVTVNL